MKQKKVNEYSPNYPKKLIKSTILTTAAAVALTGATGCAHEAMRCGAPLPQPTPTDELVLDGEVGYEIPTETLIEPGESTGDESEDLLLGGEPLPASEPAETEEPVLMGKIAVPEEPANP